MYGAEAVILALCREFQLLDNTVEIAAFEHAHRPNDQLKEAAIQRGVRLHSIPCRGQLDRGTLRQLRNLLKSGAYDIIHSHGYKTDFYLYFAGTGLRSALVATCHTWYDNDLFEYFYGMIDRLVLRRYDQVVSVSEDVTRRLKCAGVHPNRITNIENGIDVSRFQNNEPRLREELGIAFDTLMVGTVGRLSPEKGIEHLLRAAGRVVAEFPCAHFAIVGDGPERQRLEDLSKDLNLTKFVTFTGRRSDIPEVFASLDILVQPSLNEGLPITLLEALASCCAVLATRVGAVPAVLEDGVDGLLVDPGEPDQLACALLRLLREPSERLRMGTAGGNKVKQNFSSSRMANDYVSVYERALQHKSAGSGVHSQRKTGKWRSL
jgi:glycosyltransferase involved in cell wall biosynthesis